jgi:hypothetical protein
MGRTRGVSISGPDLLDVVSEYVISSVNKFVIGT